MYRYLITVFAGLFTMLALIFAFNWKIDPWGYFLNVPYGIYSDVTARHIKAVGAARSNAQVVLLGASTATWINTADLQGCRYYNAAINGGTPPELLHLIRSFLPLSTKAVILGLDFITWKEPGDMSVEPPDFGTYTLAKTVAYTLSEKAISHSLWTLKMKRKGEPSILDMATGSRANFSVIAAHEMEIPHQDMAGELEYYRKTSFSNWRYPTGYVEALRQMREELDRRGIKALVYVNPMSDALRNMLAEEDLLPNLARFRTDVQSVFPDAIDFSDQLTANDLYFKQDPLHFTPATAARMIKSILAKNHLCGY